MTRKKTVYLDNAATSWPKPGSVTSAVRDALKKPFGNPGRGSHSASETAQNAVFGLRESVASHFGSEADRVVLTSNATAGLNYALKGFASTGGHILISDLEHNSVRRPALALERELGCRVDTFRTFGGDPDMILSDIEKKLRPNDTVVVSVHVSNICNITLPIGAIGKLCRDAGCRFIVDASQSAGHRKIDVRDERIDVLCMPGHKGLYGPMGTGLMVFGEAAAREAERIRTTVEGGSGAESEKASMPDALPERLEAGTLNAHGAAGLLAGVEWIKKTGEERIAAHERRLYEEFVGILKTDKRITVYDDGGPGAVVLFNVKGASPAEVGGALDRDGICVRTGFHCAPTAHRTVGTGKDGAVRVSFGYFNTLSEVRFAAERVLSVSRVFK